ncbi:MAG: isoaspartyl peptidase/L-asparaginase family protein [Bacillota bacterium]
MHNIAIAIHGGAQNKPRSEFSEEKLPAFKSGLNEALTRGWELLSRGYSALDAVEESVRSLEDNPLFNAARGSDFTEQGDLEFDASIMWGKTLEAGTVAAVRLIKNPVSLARKVMENSNHILLAAKGAEDFAGKNNIETRPFDYFVSPEKMPQWRNSQNEKKLNRPNDTVGAVALDIDGNLAAACSTGGLQNQLGGRIGVSPSIGAGTYADIEVCAAVCTGDGELIIRGVYAHELYALIKYKNLSLHDAIEEVFLINSLSLKAQMDMIAIDPKGNIELKYNTLPMHRAYKKGNNPAYIAILEE